MSDSITIPLPCGREAFVDAEDWPEVRQFQWHSVEGNNGVFYAETLVRLPDERYARVRLHRLIIKPKPTEEIDHHNRNGLDCRRSNLRVASPMRNAQNRVKHSGGNAPYKGVNFDQRRCVKPWQAFINVEGVKRRIGAYETAREAAESYDDAAREFFGEFARVNFPRDGEMGALEGIPPEEIEIVIAEWESRRRVAGKRGRPRKEERVAA